MIRVRAANEGRYRTPSATQDLPGQSRYRARKSTARLLNPLRTITGGATERSLQPARAHLPLHAQEIYLAAFNNAWAEYEARGSDQRDARPPLCLGCGEAQIREIWRPLDPARSCLSGQVRASKEGGYSLPIRLIPINIGVFDRSNLITTEGA